MDFEEEIRKIQIRNKKVELDKAWETSKTRKISIAILTYFVMVLVMYSLNMSSPFTGAVIPTLGFTLSTFSLDFIKEFWKKFQCSIVMIEMSLFCCLFAQQRGGDADKNYAESYGERLHGGDFPADMWQKDFATDKDHNYRKGWFQVIKFVNGSFQEKI